MIRHHHTLYVLWTLLSGMRTRFLLPTPRFPLTPVSCQVSLLATSRFFDMSRFLSCPRFLLHPTAHFLPSPAPHFPPFQARSCFLVRPVSCHHLPLLAPPTASPRALLVSRPASCQMSPASYVTFHTSYYIPLLATSRFLSCPASCHPTLLFISRFLSSSPGSCCRLPRHATSRFL